jgi:TolA-binding protein
MLLATVLLSAALVPQTAGEEIETPFDAEPAQQAAPAPGETAPALEATPVPQPAAPETPPAATPPPAGTEQASIDAGLKAFIRGRFSTARDAFQRAYDANPRDPAAAFYLGYALYKLGEPSRRMDADKTRARELFAQAYSLDPLFQPVWGQKKE